MLKMVKENLREVVTQSEKKCSQCKLLNTSISLVLPLVLLFLSLVLSLVHPLVLPLLLLFLALVLPFLPLLMCTASHTCPVLAHVHLVNFLLSLFLEWGGDRISEPPTPTNINKDYGTLISNQVVVTTRTTF